AFAYAECTEEMASDLARIRSRECSSCKTCFLASSAWLAAIASSDSRRSSSLNFSTSFASTWGAKTLMIATMVAPPTPTLANHLTKSTAHSAIRHLRNPGLNELQKVIVDHVLVMERGAQIRMPHRFLDDVRRLALRQPRRHPAV